MDQRHKTAIALSSHDAKNLLFSSINRLLDLEASLSQLLAQAGGGGSVVMEEKALKKLLATIEVSRQTAELAADKIAQALHLYTASEPHEHYLTEVSVQTLVMEAIVNAQENILRRGIELVVDIGGEHGLERQQWPLNRVGVCEALTNALQNASRFAKSKILLSAKEAQGGLRFEVNDDGPGFPEEVLLGGAGHGAGLLITRDLLKELHGLLTLKNGGGLGGAVFLMELSAHAD